MNLYYQNPGSPTGLRFQGRCPEPRRSPEPSDTDTSSDSDYANPCGRPPTPPSHQPTSTDRYHGYDEVCYVPASAMATGSGCGRHVTHGQGRQPSKVVYYQNRFCAVPIEKGDQSYERRVSDFRSDSTSGRVGQHPVSRNLSRESSKDRSNDELFRVRRASQQSIEIAWQPSSRQPSSRQPLNETNASYKHRLRHHQPDDAFHTSRQQTDDVGSLSRQRPHDVGPSPGQRLRHHTDDVRLRDSIDKPSSRQRAQRQQSEDVDLPLPMQRPHRDEDNDDVTVLRQTIEDDDYDYDGVAVPLTATSGSGGCSPEVVKFSRQQHVPSSSTSGACPRVEKRIGCPGVAAATVTSGAGPGAKQGGWRDVFRKRKEYAALRKLALLLQDNRTSASTSSGLSGSEKRTAERRGQDVQAADRDSSPVLKRILNILFITTGMALLLAVVAVIIYTSIGRCRTYNGPSWLAD